MVRLSATSPKRPQDHGDSLVSANTVPGVRGLSINHFGVTAGDGPAQGGASMRGKGRLTRGRSAAYDRGVLRYSGLALMPGGCFGETFQRGYVLPDGALQQIPLGASQEQVLIVLGTPSTVATVSGEAFYYISQRAERPISFMRIEDRRPTRHRGLFRQEPKSAAARRIRHEGRQGFRLHQPHDADRRRRSEHHQRPVPHHRQDKTT